MAELFDFGFTAVTEDELEVVQKSQAKAAEVGSEAARAAETATKTQERLDSLFNAIQPLLTNLKANPQKEYIYWPNRLEKVEQFEDHIQGIYNGKKTQ
tara:strand:+ start:280 stop:573 length:294 start_codon:yes stop_codon:yes gene_type:complete